MLVLSLHIGLLRRSFIICRKSPYDLRKRHSRCTGKRRYAPCDLQNKPPS
jgi:hypothetical protein